MSKEFYDQDKPRPLTAGEKTSILIRAGAALMAFIALHTLQTNSNNSDTSKPILPIYTCTGLFMDYAPPQGMSIDEYSGSLIDNGIAEGDQSALSESIQVINPRYVVWDSTAGEYEIATDATMLSTPTKCPYTAEPTPQS